jgi:hypothetical protein
MASGLERCHLPTAGFFKGKQNIPRIVEQVLPA